MLFQPIPYEINHTAALYRELRPELEESPIASFIGTKLSDDQVEVTFANTLYRIKVSVQKYPDDGEHDFDVVGIEINYLTEQRYAQVFEITPPPRERKTVTTYAEAGKDREPLIIETPQPEREPEWRPEVLLGQAIFQNFQDAANVAKQHAHAVIRNWLEEPFSDGYISGLHLTEDGDGKKEWVGSLELNDVPAWPIDRDFRFDAKTLTFEAVDKESLKHVRRCPYVFDFTLEYVTLNDAITGTSASIAVSEACIVDEGKSDSATALAACLSHISTADECPKRISFSTLRTVYRELAKPTGASKALLSAARELSGQLVEHVCLHDGFENPADTPRDSTLAYVYALPMPGIGIEIFGFNEGGARGQRISSAPVPFPSLSGDASRIGGAPAFPEFLSRRPFEGLLLPDHGNGFLRLIFDAALSARGLPQLVRGSFDNELERYLCANKEDDGSAVVKIRGGNFGHSWAKRRPVPIVTSIDDLHDDAESPEPQVLEFRGTISNAQFSLTPPGFWVLPERVVATAARYVEVTDGLTVRDLLAILAAGYFPSISDHRKKHSE